MSGVTVRAVPGDDERRFRVLFDSTYDDLVRFVERRTLPANAPDVVAEAFLHAWRRIADVPTDASQARAWLFVTARNVLANRMRRDQHQAAITMRVATEPRAAAAGAAHDDVAARLDVGRAFARLSAADQEVLALTAWDGLSQAEAATVLGVTPGTYAVRLSRARRRLRAHLDDGTEGRRP